eukprot:1980939-Alexandrium_andersonii.AAC.1
MARRVCKVTLRPEPWAEVAQQVRAADQTVARQPDEVFAVDGDVGDIPVERRRKIEAWLNHFHRNSGHPPARAMMETLRRRKVSSEILK